jgi:hypothetical protein
VAWPCCLLVHRCKAVLLVRKGERETWVIGVNSKILGGPRQTRRMLTRQRSRSLSSTLDWGHEGRIHEVLQEDGCSSMYGTMVTQLCCRKKLTWVIYNMLSVINYSMIIPWFVNQTYNTDWCYFSQGKNKPWLPWVYSWIRHRREQ